MHNREHIGILVLATVVSLGAVGLALFTSQNEKKSLSGSPSVQAVAKASSPSAAQNDTDQDGLPNWKEVLLGTNPTVADTDQDGVSDADEVAKGADPLAFGADPVLNAPYVAPRGLPTTEALARELLSTYAELKAGGNLNAEETNTALLSLLERRLQEPTLPPTFTRSQLTIENDVSLDAYQGALTNAFNEASRVREYELNVFARAISENRSAELAKLKTTAVIYESIRDTLLAIEVPERVADDHLAVVNSLSSIETAVAGLASWGGDPLDALALVNTFSESETTLRLTLTDLFTRLTILKKS
ncbi:MAG: thrombospondin type 3 repeat-containing protein [Patescibacteria group bacterium]